MKVDALDLLTTSVLFLNEQGEIGHANAAAEDLFGQSRRQLIGQQAAVLFEPAAELEDSILRVLSGRLAHVRQSVSIARPQGPIEVSVTSTALVSQPWPIILETREVEQRLLADRNHRVVEEIETHRLVLRNLAHEVKNPLGALRGAAQLLEAELPEASLIEYTQVIISEADRLQALVDRLIGPQRARLNTKPVNIHEVCERVCALL
jgi:two-component system nitrogen regulation sensor histidine kinase GlnL